MVQKNKNAHVYVVNLFFQLNLDEVYVFTNEEDAIKQWEEYTKQKYADFLADPELLIDSDVENSTIWLVKVDSTESTENAALSKLQ